MLAIKLESVIMITNGKRGLKELAPAIEIVRKFVYPKHIEIITVKCHNSNFPMIIVNHKFGPKIKLIIWMSIKQY